MFFENISRHLLWAICRQVRSDLYLQAFTFEEAKAKVEWLRGLGFKSPRYSQGYIGRGYYTVTA